MTIHSGILGIFFLVISQGVLAHEDLPNPPQEANRRYTPCVVLSLEDTVTVPINDKAYDILANSETQKENLVPGAFPFQIKGKSYMTLPYMPRLVGNILFSFGWKAAFYTHLSEQDGWHIMKKNLLKDMRERFADEERVASMWWQYTHEKRFSILSRTNFDRKGIFSSQNPSPKTSDRDFFTPQRLKDHSRLGDVKHFICVHPLNQNAQKGKYPCVGLEKEVIDNYQAHLQKLGTETPIKEGMTPYASPAFGNVAMLMGYLNTLIKISSNTTPSEKALNRVFVSTIYNSKVHNPENPPYSPMLHQHPRAKDWLEDGTQTLLAGPYRSKRHISSLPSFPKTLTTALRLLRR